MVAFVQNQGFGSIVQAKTLYSADSFPGVSALCCDGGVTKNPAGNQKRWFRSKISHRNFCWVALFKNGGRFTSINY